MSQLTLFMVCIMKRGAFSTPSPQRKSVRHIFQKGKKKDLKMSMDAIITMIENFIFKNHKTYCLGLRSLQQVKNIYLNHLDTFFSQKIDKYSKIPFQSYFFRDILQLALKKSFEVLLLLLCVKVVSAYGLMINCSVKEHLVPSLLSSSICCIRLSDREVASLQKWPGWYMDFMQNGSVFQLCRLKPSEFKAVWAAGRQIFAGIKKMKCLGQESSYLLMS